MTAKPIKRPKLVVNDLGFLASAVLVFASFPGINWKLVWRIQRPENHHVSEHCRQAGQGFAKKRNPHWRVLKGPLPAPPKMMVLLEVKGRVWTFQHPRSRVLYRCELDAACNERWFS